jgi:Rrf2 family protein
VLAGSQEISEGYLEQLLRELKKGGVVDTVRGAQGGYELTCDPAELSVQRVLNLLEGSTAIVDCVGPLLHNCTSACSCSARPLFLKLQKRINDVLECTTIREMADDYLQQRARGVANKNVCELRNSG